MDFPKTGSAKLSKLLTVICGSRLPKEWCVLTESVLRLLILKILLKLKVIMFNHYWLTGAERELGLEPGDGLSLLPLQPEPLGRSAQMVTTILLCQYVYFALDMPPDANSFALFLLSIVPDAFGGNNCGTA